MNQPGTLVWLARHELRLAWRDWVAMVTAGHRRRVSTIVIALTVFFGFMHLVAYSIVYRYALTQVTSDRATLVVVTGIVLLSLSPLVSQAMELVTRIFYSRSDLDLILTSPVSPREIFSVRIGRIAIEVALLAMLLAMPFIDVLTVLGGPRWFVVYCVVVAFGLLATALGVVLVMALFRIIGAKRTRLIAQIMAAVVGAAFVVGLQIFAILSYGGISLPRLQSKWLVTHVPDVSSPIWWPARSLLGNPNALLLVTTASIVIFVTTTLIFAGRFGEHVVAAAGVSQAVVHQHCQSNRFRRRAVNRVLRRKEWTLLLRDPWLLSQILLQLFYLLPPALFLWYSFHTGTSADVLMVPMIVMAAGHLGGNLAWLSISGEDAPDLVGTAPISAQRVTWAKVEAVAGAIAFIIAPLIIALGFASVRAALVALLGTTISVASATLIQLLFRTQGRRNQFRHRQVASSRLASFTEAFSSITWAGTSALAVTGSWLTPIMALVAFSVLGGVWLISPQETRVSQAYASQ